MGANKEISAHAAGITTWKVPIFLIGFIFSFILPITWLYYFLLHKGLDNSGPFNNLALRKRIYYMGIFWTCLIILIIAIAIMDLV